MVSHKHCKQPPNDCPQLPNVTIEIRNFLTDDLLGLMYHQNDLTLDYLENIALTRMLLLPQAGAVASGAPYTVQFHYGRLSSGARLTAEECQRHAYLVRANREGRVMLYAHFLPAAAFDTGFCQQVRNAIVAARRARKARKARQRR